jgi:seryl-tRNA synthetase
MSSSSSLAFILESDKELDESDHCVIVATKDSLQAKHEDSDKTRRSSSKRLSKRASACTSLDAFVEECNSSFSAMDLLNDRDNSDIMTVDSRVPNMTGSKTRLTSERLTRRPVKRTVTPPEKESFPVQFERGF